MNNNILPNRLNVLCRVHGISLTWFLQAPVLKEKCEHDLYLSKQKEQYRLSVT